MSMKKPFTRLTLMGADAPGAVAPPASSSRVSLSEPPPADLFQRGGQNVGQFIAQPNLVKGMVTGLAIATGAVLLGRVLNQ